MIREAERSDKDQIFELFRMLVPNSKKMNVLEEQIEKIRRDTNTKHMYTGIAWHKTVWSIREYNCV